MEHAVDGLRHDRRRELGEHLVRVGVGVGVGVEVGVKVRVGVRVEVRVRVSGTCSSTSAVRICFHSS